MSIWFGTPTVEELAQSSLKGVAEQLGITFTEIGEDYLELRMPVTEKTLQPHGILHGGVSVVLAETACSVGATLTLDTEKQFAVGQEINANHIRPGTPGDVITARATPISRGRSSQVWDIRLHNQDGKLVCISRCTMAIRDHA
ncbi:PaaI family thioesterase [Enteractinococcus fodinae]|uniref:1,4-dihydroxy-2-naphthoyl-CoA hydrolase n=1 Tax=Enteractinococcus fodinae TaxID=684663 RepID=A0ABU2AXT6_9MICC|nr:PaaI family thioesterase [Enteractinococcus fodinae]MDR7346161.1 1,4-dihydroxy-2-naphthoyl-CoA hydrolase [Enteractinococcus fodinae]